MMAAKKKKRGKSDPKKTSAKLVETLEFYLKLEPPLKNKGGRPPQFMEGLSPEDVVGLRQFVKNPAIGGEFFWAVFSIAEIPEGRESVNERLLHWEN